jgi:ribosomal-protein-alanine N-acetyltransferase
VREELETARLRLRRFRSDDLETLVRWHADPELMRHMGKRSFSRAEVEAMAVRHERHWQRHGFGLWAVEEKETGDVVGRAGIAFHRAWPDDPEVGWLVDLPWQGRGYATEGGDACVRYAFEELEFPRVVSICVRENTASRRVMEKLGFVEWQEVEDPVLGLTLVVHRRDRAGLDRPGRTS